MICGWKEYKMKDFFSISRGQRFVKVEHESGDMPYYSASNENNGVTDYISNPLFIEENALVYTTFGDCFYVEGKFTASDEISILKYPEINKYNALFIAGIVNSNKYKYEFKQKAFRKAFENDVIKLPIGINGLPNFKYMEQYIRNMEVKQKDKLNKLQEIQN